MSNDQIGKTKVVEFCKAIEKNVSALEILQSSVVRTSWFERDCDFKNKSDEQSRTKNILRLKRNEMH